MTSATSTLRPPAAPRLRELANSTALRDSANSSRRPSGPLSLRFRATLVRWCRSRVLRRRTGAGAAHGPGSYLGGSARTARAWFSSIQISQRRDAACRGS